MTARLLDATHSRLLEAIREGNLRGAVVAVANRTELLDCRAVGVVGAQPTSTPLRPRDRFLLTSITKTFTATQVLQLVEQGRLALEAPVASYLPAFAANGKADVRVWHLLTHTSGLDQQANTAERATPGMTAAGHLQQALMAGLTFTPGERVEYCSPTFWVLAELITQLSGELYVDHFARHVAAACGLSSTGYDTRATTDAIPAYGVADPSVPDQQRRLAYPAGAVVSTAEDLVLFGQALLNAGRTQTDQRLLAPATVRAAVEARTAGLRGNPFGTTRSLGFAVGGPGTLRSQATFGHGGASGTYMWVDPHAEVVVVFLSANWSLDQRLLAAVIDSVLGQLSLGD